MPRPVLAILCVMLGVLLGAVVAVEAQTPTPSLDERVCHLENLAGVDNPYCDSPPTTTTIAPTIPPTTTVAPTTTVEPTSTVEATTTVEPSTTAGASTTTSTTPHHECDFPTDVPLGALVGQPGPMFCHSGADAPSTFVNGDNSWVDDFNHGALMAPCCDGYVTTDGINQIWQSVHWRHADHWMVDIAPYDEDGAGGSSDDWGTGGTAMRPDRSFRFENGTLVVEAVVAAGITDYEGVAWPEIVVSTSPTPALSEAAAPYPDYAYAYGWFPNSDTVGIRLQADGVPIAAWHTTNNARVWELSYFQHAGETVNRGGYPAFSGRAQRTCEGGVDPDTMCRDLFRWELTKTSYRLFVNGRLYWEVSGLPASSQLPDSIVNGDVYVYFGDVVFKPSADTVRFHWDRVAINP